MPSREDVLTFIEQNGGHADKRQIARAFGVSGHDRIALKRLLRDLAEEGLIEGGKRRFVRAGDLPPVTVLKVTGRTDDGDLTAVPTTWSEDLGEPPRARIVTRRRDRGRSLPGIGDRVLARLERVDDPAVAYDASVIKVLAAEPDRILGVLSRHASGWVVEPIQRKQKTVDLEGDPGDAREGDLVSVAPIKGRRYGPIRARLVEVVGPASGRHAASFLAIHAHGLPHVFDERTLEAARAAQPVSTKGREDWRDLPLVTIDPVDARDHDDAVIAEPDVDPGNPDGVVLTVAIADVAYYVRPGSALDRTALERGNSVYFPDRVIPMLPERISNDLCSLRAGEDRPAIAVRMVFGADGHKRHHSVHRVLIRVAANLAYETAQRAFDGNAGDIDGDLDSPLAETWRAYRILARSRDMRAPLDLDLPERKVILDKAGRIERIIVPQRLEAHRLIEEFMIQANVAAAETLERHESPLVYRIHDAPSLARIEALRDFLKSIELSIPRAGNLRPEHFNRVLGAVRESEHQTLVSEAVLRAQSQAVYSAENIGHFGLNLRRYAHFTSPIRRYADLLVHRALITALRLGKDGMRPDTADDLPEIAARISASERRAMAAERDAIDRLVAHWLAERVGSAFTGRISGVTRAGLFVRLDDSGADGFVPISSIGREYYRHDEAAFALIGEDTRTAYRLGDAVEVRLLEAIPLTGGLRFELLSEGRPLEGTARTARRPSGQPRSRRRRR